MPVIISPNMVIGGSSGTIPPFPLTHARIGYKTICTRLNVIASSESAGNPAEDAVNPFTNEYWAPVTLPATWTCSRASAVDTDYIGIAGHTLGTYGNTVKIEYSTDGTTYVELYSFTPTDNTPIMLIYATVTALNWRLTVSGGTGIPRIGVIYIGESMQMQRPLYGGHAPLKMSRSTTILNQMSEAGQFTARSIIRRGVGTLYEWNNLTADWVRQYFDPFAKAARRVPFFIAWRPISFPAETGFVWTKSDLIPVNMGVKNYMSVSMEVAGVGDD